MKTLVLDHAYQPLSFITFKRMAKLVMSEKAVVESVWHNTNFYANLNIPSIIVLNDYIRKGPLTARFSFKGILKRDMYVCQYSEQALTGSQATVDHIIPKSRGGKSSWDNCVTCCREINLQKGNRTPEEAGLKLINQPKGPKDALVLEYTFMVDVHKDWMGYFPGVDRPLTRMHF